jgi:predicted nucleotidyltransferase
MRLSPDQLRAIKTLIEREFDADTRIWLFGSRVDDSRRGGDIDLYIETEHPRLLNELRCKVDIEEAVDLHVDLIVALPDDHRPIARIAKSQGIRL